MAHMQEACQLPGAARCHGPPSARHARPVPTAQYARAREARIDWHDDCMHARRVPSGASAARPGASRTRAAARDALRPARPAGRPHPGGVRFSRRPHGVSYGPLAPHPHADVCPIPIPTHRPARSSRGTLHALLNPPGVRPARPCSPYSGVSSRDLPLPHAHRFRIGHRPRQPAPRRALSELSACGNR